MVNTNDYYWVTLTQKNMVTSDSNYNHFFWVVVTGQFLQCRIQGKSVTRPGFMRCSKLALNANSRWMSA